MAVAKKVALSFPSSAGVLLTRDHPVVPVKGIRGGKGGIYQQQHVLANLSLVYQLIFSSIGSLSRGKNQLCVQTAFHVHGA